MMTLDPSTGRSDQFHLLFSRARAAPKIVGWALTITGLRDLHFPRIGLDTIARFECLTIT
jgi:hypothetical protein